MLAALVTTVGDMPLKSKIFHILILILFVIKSHDDLAVLVTLIRVITCHLLRKPMALVDRRKLHKPKAVAFDHRHHMMSCNLKLQKPSDFQ